MNIAVCAKITPDTTAQIKTKPDGSGIERAGIKWAVNEYDTFAIEEGIRLREKGAAGKVHLFAVGDDETVNTLRAGGLAVGADDLSICKDPSVSDSLAIAKVLVAMIQKTADIGLVFCGRRAIDDDNVQVPAMVAELLGWPQVSMVSALTVEGGTFTATRNVGGGVHEVVKGSLPAVMTCDKGFNTPRFAKLPDIMKAKTKPVHDRKLADLGLSAADVAPAVVVSAYGPPPARPKGKIIAGDPATQVKELIRLLREEAKVI